MPRKAIKTTSPNTPFRRAATTQNFARTLLVLRGQRVILDADLAALYSVSTKVLNQAVKRNAARFPGDFLFRLTQKEVMALNRSQSGDG